LIAAWIERVFSGAQRFLPDAAMPGAHQGAKFEIRAGGILRGEAHVGLDDGDLPLLYNQHSNHLDADEERIERIGAVEQRIMLQTDFAAIIYERLKILIIVVQIVFVSQQDFDYVAVSGFVLFHLVYIGKAAEAAGNIAGGKWVAFGGGNDADHVRKSAVLTAGAWFDTQELELVGLEAECFGT